MSFARKILAIIILRYRNSPFYSERNGRFLARVAGLITPLVVGSKPKIIVHRGVTLEVDPTEIIDISLMIGNTFEPEVEARIEHVLGSGMTCIDIGANVGYHTLPMARLVGDTGHVIAIEPSPWALKRLARNLELNSELVSRVTVVDRYLSDRTVTISVDIQSSYPMNASKARREIMQLETATLDDLVNSLALEQIHLIKVDVDGGEVDVLLGSRRTIERWKPQILLEVSPHLWSHDAAVKMRDLLKESRYEIRSLRGAAIIKLDQYLHDLSEKSTSGMLHLS